MFSFFTETLNQHLYPTNTPQAQQPPQQAKSSQPPASNQAINSLPVVKVTADDLLEETNKECVVCLVEQTLGSTACKLPCGHLFHKACVAEWLTKHCTCPVCRYELETSDPSFEGQRKQRMKSRKLRMRLDEIKAKSVSQLKQLCLQQNVSIAHCLDKQELVDALLASGCIDLTERIPPMEMTSEEFSGKSVSQLRHLLLSFGLSAEGALEKAELRAVLLASDRIVLYDPPSSSSAPSSSSGSAEEGKPSAEDSAAAAAPVSPALSPIDVGVGWHTAAAASPSAATSSATVSSAPSSPCPVSPVRSESASSPADHHHRGAGSVSYRLSELQGMSLTNLKQLSQQLGVSLTNCLYKSDIVERLQRCSKMRILQEQEEVEVMAEDGSSS